MKRTLITVDVGEYPTTYRSLLQGCAVYDSSCSPEARVLLIERDGGCFLKSAPVGTLQNEAVMTRYFGEKGLGATVLDYRTEQGRDWLLTTRVAGEDCTHYLEDPRRLTDLIATRLRALHELPFAGCPVSDRTAGFLAAAEEGYRLGRCDLSFHAMPQAPFKTAEEAVAFLAQNKHLLARDTLLHGDYCLPNIMLDEWRFSGFIDVGNGGVGDRHVDLFWGAWTLAFNLKTEAYRERFFDAYGRDKVEDHLLSVVAAAEVFG